MDLQDARWIRRDRLTIDGRSDKVLDVYAATLSELVEASWMQVVFSRERGAVALYLLGNFGANENLTTPARKELPPLETALATADTAEGPSPSAPAGARVPPRRWRRQDHPRQRRAAVSATARRAGTLTAPEDAGSKPHQRQAQVPRQ